MPLYVVYGFCSKENCKVQLSNDKLSKHYLKKLNICCFIFSQRTRATVDCKSFPSKHKSIQSAVEIFMTTCAIKPSRGETPMPKKDGGLRRIIYEKNLLEKPLSCFVGVTWNCFRPKEVTILNQHVFCSIFFRSNTLKAVLQKLPFWTLWGGTFLRGAKTAFKPRKSYE